MKQETAGGTPYQVPPEPNRWPAIGLAVGVHALLLAFLVIGINWQNHEPVAVEAEVWDVNTQVAAPPPPPPQPEPEPQPETPPPPQPVPKEAPPPPVEQPAPPKQPDIALEREKQRKEELKQQKLEQEREERERELAEQKAEEKKAKALAEKKAQEEAEKRAEELAKKDEAEKKKKADKEKADKLTKAKAEQARLDKLRAAEMKRMMAAADNVGSGNTGTAEKSSGPRRDNGYIAAITAKVKGNSAYGGDLDQPGNPTVTFHVEQLPTGEIISVRKTKSSGIPTFDDAVQKAIEKSSPLPKKKDGTVERSLEINFHMKDMQ